MEKIEQSELKHKILSITKRTRHGYKCMASRKCTYSQPQNRFMVTSFCRHVKTFHIHVYNALLLGKVEESFLADRTKDGKHRMTLKMKIMSVLKVTDTDYKCGVSDQCTYKQPLDKLTPGNFARHIAALHPEFYKKMVSGKLDADHKPPKQHVMVSNIATIKSNRIRFICGIVRLVTCHGLPFDCVSWQGMQDIMAPQLEAFKMTMDEENLREIVEQTANRMQKMIYEDMRGRMVSIQLHGMMGKNGQYLVRVTCSYLKDTYVCKRTLGIIVLDETNTCQDLEEKINKIKEKCGLQQWQIYTISIDYGRIDLEENVSDEQEQRQQAEVDESKFIEILGQYNGSLSDVTVLQCGRHLLSMVATDVTQDFGEIIEEIVEMVKSFRYDEYKLYFQTWQGRYPPIPNKNNYGFGTYLMMKALKDERSFFEQFTTHYPGYALYLHWDLIDEFVTAFEPLYECAVRISDCGLSDFHLQWLLAYGRIRCIAVNRFREKLLQVMETRQKTLEEMAPYKAALYMDPRLNFRGSKLFDLNKRQKVVTFLQSIYTMSENTSDKTQGNSNGPSSSSTQGGSGEFSMNALLTEMLGEASPESAMGDLIWEIQQQERCDADDAEFSIIKYWIQKKIHDSRLWTLAMVVFSPLATHCNDVDGEFSQLANVVSTSNRSSALEDSLVQQYESILPHESLSNTENDAWNALFIKQNPNLLEGAIAQEFLKKKSTVSETDSKEDV